MPDLDAYKVLQVDPEADEEVIRAAYRGLARKFHPDVAPGPEAAARMADINAAWELVGDEEARRRYDESRVGRSGGHPGGGPDAGPRTRPSPSAGGTQRPPDTVSHDWTSGRSTTGGGYDPSMRSSEGFGAAGPPPGRPSGSVLNFGRFAGWSLGEVARTDIEYIEWLDRAPIGRQYRDEIDQILRRAGRRVSAAEAAKDQRGLYRRR